MVSKNVLFALTVVALASGGVSALLTSEAQNFNYCVAPLQVINLRLNLGLDLGGLISNVLGIVKSLVGEVLNLVQRLLGGIGGLLTGLLGGGGGKKVIPCPTDLSRALQYVQLGLYVNDCGLRKNLGINIYKRFYLSQIFIYTCRTALLNSNINISSYTWLKLDANFDLDVYCNELYNIRYKVKGGALLNIIYRIEDLLDFILDNIDDIVSNVLGDVVSLAWNLIFGYSRGCGYTEYQKGYTVVVTTYTTVLKKYNCGTINYQYLTYGNYCNSCIR